MYFCVCDDNILEEKAGNDFFAKLLSSNWEKNIFASLKNSQAQPKDVHITYAPLSVRNRELNEEA